MADMYNQAVVTDPIDADTANARLSDHRGVLLLPRNNINEVRSTEYTYKIIRPMPE